MNLRFVITYKRKNELNNQEGKKMSEKAIQNGTAVLGIEFGSTRIKSVLIDENHEIIAQGSHEWENELKDGIWTYRQEAVIKGLQASFAALKKDVSSRYGLPLTSLGGLGLSAMMHGYLPFDQDMNLLVPFRTWRNTITAEASEKLTERFRFNMPQRWSLSHLYQAILNREEHVPDIRFLTTLAGWVHYLLTGEKVLGIGDASGMMPIDSATLDFDQKMVRSFDELIADRHYPWKLREILPRVLCAGEEGGRLTRQGALLLDPSGELKEGCPVCPPEGDAGTGMTATNSVRVRTGNVSAGTSIFSMIVLEKPMSAVHPEIDIVTTPTGQQVGMVHCNSCTSDLNAWIGLFAEAAKLLGAEFTTDELFTKLFQCSQQGDSDGAGIVSFNYYSGEPVTGCDSGRPMLVRLPDAKMTLANFMKVQLYASMETLKYGMEIMTQEKVAIDRVYGHGGLFKPPEVAQRILAAAIHAPVTVMETAGEGGAWGIALLAAYMIQKRDGQMLEDYLDQNVFRDLKQMTIEPDPADEDGFARYMDRFWKCIPAERTAAKNFLS